MIWTVCSAQNIFLMLCQEQQVAFESLTCKIAACVDWEAFKHYSQQGVFKADGERQPKFVQYALAAAHEALKVSAPHLWKISLNDTSRFWSFDIPQQTVSWQ